jgi:hypothetical protein
MLYKHYKGALYRVLGECKHSETLKDMTVYMSVNDGLLWVRPTSMFHELINTPDGKYVPRFAEVDEDLIAKQSLR